MRTILEDTGFWLAAGVALVAIVALVVVHASTDRWWGGAGTVAVLGALVALMVDDEVPLEALAGIALLAVGGWVAGHRSRILALLPIVPGAVLVGLGVRESAPFAPGWVPIALGGAAGIAAALVDDFEFAQPRLVGVCLAIGAAGVYWTVPDTEQARALLGAAVISALMGLVPGLRPAPAGSAAALALMMWIVGEGGFSRDAAVIGGLVCAGVLVLGVLVRWWRTPGLAVVAVQLGLVAVVARGAGLRDRATIAVAIVVVAYLVAALALWVAGRMWPAQPTTARRAVR